MTNSKQSGPGIFITAAFIGPGTLTVCTLSGIGFGFQLLWVLLFALIATVTLQDMSLRVGTIGKSGLGEALSKHITGKQWRTIILSIVFLAVVLGNTAYEAGNISGAALGLSALAPQMEWKIDAAKVQLFPLLIGVLAVILISRGSFHLLRNVLLLAVILMSGAFIIAAIWTQPSIVELFQGLIPKLPDGSVLIAIGLLGTTIVPYNLFLHASLSKLRWSEPGQLKHAKRDSFYAILIGVLISMSIVIAAAFHMGGEVTGVIELAAGLEPVFGGVAPYIIGVGLMAAGLSSAITAPLAAAFVCSEIFGWDGAMKDFRFKVLATFIVLVGVVFSSLGIKPILLIQMAQVANGILLPLIAVLLLWLANNKEVLGIHTNTSRQNLVAAFVIIITILLGSKSLITLFL